MDSARYPERYVGIPEMNAVHGTLNDWAITLLSEVETNNTGLQAAQRIAGEEGQALKAAIEAAVYCQVGMKKK